MRARTTGVVTCVLVAALCAAGGMASGASGAAFTISGSVINGPPGNSNPVTNSAVTLYQAGVISTTYGVTPVPPVVTTDRRGRFTMLFRNTPAPGAILYLVAHGGNAG